MAKCSKCGRTSGGCPHTAVLSPEARKRAEAEVFRYPQTVRTGIFGGQKIHKGRKRR